MSLLAVTAAVTDAIADLCGGAPEPAAVPDPADSAAYLAVADDARAAGDPRTAALAYRNAIALDPGNARAAAALAALCHAAATAADSTDDAALLAAIALYRAGQPGRAGAAFSVIAGAGGPTAAAARFFLGLIAFERHDPRAALRELELARTDPDYRDLATALLRLTHREGAIAVSLVVEPELDTNPQLLPDTPPAGALSGAPQVDEAVLTAATITVRPRPWLVLREILAWRNQRQLSALDFVGETAQAAVELARGPDHVGLRYALDDDLLGGASYLLANGAGVDYRRDGGAVALVASYSLRYRAYANAAQQAFTGWVHAGDAGAVIHLGGGIDLDARLAGGREVTSDGSFANTSGAVVLGLRTRPTRPVRLAVTTSAGYARYDHAEPDGQLRQDVPLEAGADLELDLSDHVTAVAGASAKRNVSSIADFDYAKLVVRCGLVVAFGAL